MKKRIQIFVAAISLVGGLISPAVLAAEAIVYSVYKGIDLGNPNDENQKDYFVNLGTNNGVTEGSLLEVSRRSPTYDLTTEKLYKDLVYPFATLRVIHVEKDAAIARLEKIYPTAKTPVLTPRAVIVGDLVNPSK